MVKSIIVLYHMPGAVFEFITRVHIYGKTLVTYRNDVVSRQMTSSYVQWRASTINSLSVTHFSAVACDKKNLKLVSISYLGIWNSWVDFKDKNHSPKASHFFFKINPLVSYSWYEMGTSLRSSIYHITFVKVICLVKYLLKLKEITTFILK